MKRHQARELALKILFACDLGGIEPGVVMGELFREEKTDEAGQAFCRKLVDGVLQHRSEVDNYIKKYAVEWDINRMAGVDRNIMRVALFEILFSDDTPRAVAIDEALELAKTYGSDESTRFINGILGRIIKDARESQGVSTGEVKE